MGHDHEGQRVSRRSLFAGLSAVGLGTLLASCGEGSTVTTSTGETISPQASTTADLTGLFSGASTCSLTATTTQGPYYFDADKIRSDIREDKQGKQLRVAIKVQDSESCAPLTNAVVEIWHCDASGLYSGAESSSTGGGAGALSSGMPSGGPGGGAPPSGMPAGGPGGGAPPSGMPGGQPGGSGASMADLTPTDDKRYLRGAQVTNRDGIVQFTTIWPGWYRGRTVHIHAMVHVSNNRVLTTQMMFDEALNTKVFANQPYAARTGRDTFNDRRHHLPVEHAHEGHRGERRIPGRHRLRRGLRPRRRLTKCVRLCPFWTTLAWGRLQPSGGSTPGSTSARRALAWCSVLRTTGRGGPAARRSQATWPRLATCASQHLGTLAGCRSVSSRATSTRARMR